MVDLLGLNQRIGDLQRLREIINVLIKHGYGHLLHEWNLHEFLPFGEKLVKRLRSSEPQHPGWSRLRAVFEDLGPTFVKFGQIMSLRTDLIPPDLARELESLQDTVEPESWENMKPVLEEELGDRLADLEIEPDPVASASLAQVYRASLPDGDEVVLKVQRPEI
jgi:ubiquinone biosynthesis protein